MIDALTGQGRDVGQACLTLGVSRGGYYAWKGRPTPPKRLRRIWLANEIIEIHKASRGTYGEPRVTAETLCRRVEADVESSTQNEETVGGVNAETEKRSIRRLYIAEVKFQSVRQRNGWASKQALLRFSGLDYRRNHGLVRKNQIVTRLIRSQNREPAHQEFVVVCP